VKIDDQSRGRRRPGQPLRRPVGLSEEVYNAIFEQLLSLGIAPGERIMIDALARDLGVSQTPVREALSRLESEGLIHKTHLVGYRAAPQLSRKQFEDLYDLRLLLEPYIAGRAAARISPDQIKILKNLAVEMAGERSDEQHGYGRFAQLDKRFHDEITQAAGNDLVEDALSRLHTHIHLFRLAKSDTITDEALTEHDAILSALERGDQSGSAAVMRKHIERSRERFLSML
jgi:DNA-binding GntR family transcriptional regulator